MAVSGLVSSMTDRSIATRIIDATIFAHPFATGSRPL